MTVSCTVEFMPPFDEMAGTPSTTIVIDPPTLEAATRRLCELFPGLKPILGGETDMFPVAVIRDLGTYRLGDRVELTEESHIALVFPMGGG